MTLATLDRIARRFGDLEILSSASLQLDLGERVGIVGANGSGKTTLIRILAGADEPDLGTRTLRKGLRLAYAEQVPRLSPGMTVREFVRRGDGSFDDLASRIAGLEARLADSPDDPEALRDYGELQTAFEAGGGYERDHVCERVLDGIGFRGDALDKDLRVLSGGEKSRVVLASLMTTPADLLILDEPTNHLDLEGIAYVEEQVQRHPGTVVVVSHDRHFLDAIATRIVEVDDGTTQSYKGNYTAWKKQRDERLLAEMRAFKNQQAFIEKEMDYVRRNMGSRMTRQAKGRLRKLARLETINAPKRGQQRTRLQFGNEVRGRTGQTMIEARGLSVKAGELQVVDRQDLRVNFGETVALLGRNGAGKSTLLRAMVGQLPPSAGDVERAHGLRIARFSQEVTELPLHLTVFAALRQVDPEATDKEIRDHLALFLFHGEEVESPVEGLSGGEKQRLNLARLTRSPYDLLLLDEPTNHLDMEGREGLEDAIRGFPGTVVIVTHDRALIDTVCDRVLYLEGGQVRDFRGSLDECMDSILQERAQKRSAAKHEKQAARAETAATAEPKKAAQATKIRNPMKFAELEANIVETEEKLETARSDMALEENYRDAQKFQALQELEKTLERELQKLYERWENWN
ncbi:MAG: ABC-F family ATP-binding cassette domain-containing protein [Planctomycetota bacterium]